MSLSSVLNCWRYLSLEACGTAQSLAPVFGELLVNDVVEEEFELKKERRKGMLACQKKLGKKKNHLMETHTIILCGQCFLPSLYSSLDFKPLIAARLPGVISQHLISSRGSCCEWQHRQWPSETRRHWISDANQPLCFHSKQRLCKNSKRMGWVSDVHLRRMFGFVIRVETLTPVK